MSNLENRVELFRGQIEELQGRMQQALGQLEGPRGMGTILRGRAMEMQGKARQGVARARIGVSDLTRDLQRHPEALAPWLAAIAAGITFASLAAFSPRTIVGAWHWLRHRYMDMMGAATEGAGATGPGFGGRTGTTPGPF